MATDCTQETVLRFLMERGGTVKNLELIDHFKAVLTSDPNKKEMMKDAFKMHVDNVAFVKLEDGTKYVCLKKKYRGSIREDKNTMCGDNGSERSEQSVINCENDALTKNMLEGSAIHNVPQINLSDCNKAEERSLEFAGNDDAKQEIPPGSGYRSDNSREVERSLARDSSSDGVHASSTALLVPESNNRSKMGNNSSCAPVKKRDEPSEGKQHTSDQSIPKIAVIEASPLPAASDGTMFSLPQPVHLPQHDGTLSEADAFDDHNSKKYSEAVPSNPQGPEKSYEDILKGVVRRRKSGGSQRSVGSNISEGSDEGHFDTTSMSGSDTNTPRGSRKNFIELMMNSSPQVRRSMVLRNSVYLSARHKDSRSDSETGSIVSSITDDESTPVSLDPMEHEWMMCASDGEWESLHRLLACEPNLISKKDFVTGFTCLHWAAKLGKQELLALLVNYAKQHAVPININARSSAGYTPLHLAAMHNHVDVVKLLVGAYDADVEARDYSGKKACQYLPKSVAREICEITGGHEESDIENNDYGESSRWRLSKVLQSNLRPLKLLNHSEEDVQDGASATRVKPLRRKSSLSKMKPKLHKIRFRTQIVHSTSFSDRQLSEVARHKSPPRTRPMSSLFG
ncbi:ankyrin repeat domain-containing protein SOWAHC-like [Sardina pilchardus]|uniref:ankyrin repeat domain-containing protein SOWAHC-like n=1 Tax=Sardina pilchardus TaxID=27697 RepID=UPI002E0E2176